MLVVGAIVLILLAVEHVEGQIVPLTRGSDSFPSGHAVSSMTFAVAVLLLAWPSARWRWPIVLAATAYALAVGVSRVYLGVHYPADVLAGWCVSVALTTALWLGWPHVTTRIERRLRIRFEPQTTTSVARGE